MKTSLLACLLTVASLANLPAAALVSGTLTDYVALGLAGGTIGTTRFSSFVLLPPQTGATELSPDLITINPIGGPGMPGLEIVINDSATADDLFGSRFSFTVSDSQISVVLLGVGDTAASGTGELSVIEDLDFAAGPDETLLVFRTAADQELSAQNTFSPATSFSVAMDVTLDGGGGGGLASLGSVTTQFVVVPEPATLALCVPAALVAALRRRRV
jgi:hypothetical protein